MYNLDEGIWLQTIKEKGGTFILSQRIQGEEEEECSLNAGSKVKRE